jgi:hypothetical protein
MMSRVACVVVVVATATSAVADSQECASEAAALRATLAADATQARRWNLGWDIAFGAATAGQLALVIGKVNPLGAFDDNFKESLIVGAAKSGIGFLAHVILPLRIEVPPETADACEDRAALRLALVRAAKRERSTFWLDHIGTFAVNLAGAIVLAERRSWQVGLGSAALGYPIGVLSVYTAPRRSWHAWRAREASWTVAAGATRAGPSVWIVGSF